MDITQTLLKNLSGGELQKLSEEILVSLYPDGLISHYGNVEGGTRTRKGIPDLWIENNNSEGKEYIFVSSTCDSRKNKLFEDVKKSIEKFKDVEKQEKIKVKKIICFLNYDPDVSEVSSCKKLCKDEKTSFIYYTNNNLSKLLDEKYLNLRAKYLNLKYNEGSLTLELSNSEDADLLAVSSFVKNINWISSKEEMSLSMVIKEILLNSIKYGEASKFEIIANNHTVVLKEDGKKFNLLSFDDLPTSGFGGGKKTLDLFNEKFEDFTIKYEWKEYLGENRYILKKKYEENNYYAYQFNKKCEFNLGSEFSKNSKIVVPEKCKEVIIQIKEHDFMMSRLLRVEEVIKLLLTDIDYKLHKFKIVLPKNKGMIEDKINELFKIANLDNRVTIEEADSN